MTTSLILRKACYACLKDAVGTPAAVDQECYSVGEEKGCSDWRDCGLLRHQWYCLKCIEAAIPDCQNCASKVWHQKHLEEGMGFIVLDKKLCLECVVASSGV